MAHNNKGTTCNEIRQYERAIECFNKSIFIKPENDVGYLKKGNSLYNMARYKDAVKCFDRAFQLNTKNEEAIKNKGYALEKLKMA